MVKISESGRNAAIARLQKFVRPGGTVFTILRSVSRSGMSREISAVMVSSGGDIINLDYNISKALGYPTGKRGIKVSGCGMDMGFEVVYNLGRALFPQGFGVRSVGGVVPTSPAHAAALVAEGKTRFCGRNGDPTGWDNDGGYALSQRWL